MAGQERTEAPTPRRRQEIREQGRAPRSIEVQTATALLMGFLGLRLFGPSLLGSLAAMTHNAFAGLSRSELTTGKIEDLASNWGRPVLQGMLPMLGLLMIAGVSTGLLQTGFLVSGQALRPDLSRLNPAKNLQRLFSGRAMVDLAKAAVKVTVVTLVVWQLIQGHRAQLLLMAQFPLAQSARLLLEMVLDMGLQSALVFLAIAGVDYGYQRWIFERDLRMTRQEVRESLRQTEGDPRMKSRIREQARRYARGRMLLNVPRAAVVITNPVHLAVALEYRPRDMKAPRIVAKGERLLAERIRGIALEHKIPVVENRALAWALHRGAEVGQYIPAALYRAVAEVLAFVFSVRQQMAQSVLPEGGQTVGQAQWNASTGAR